MLGISEIAARLHMSEDMTEMQISNLIQYQLLEQQMIPTLKNTSRHFFSLPNELFSLEFGHGTITVYVILLYCEDGRTQPVPPQL